MNIDPAIVEPAITKKTKAIITVDISGCPCDYDRLTQISEKYGLFLITDGAHSLGAEYNGRPIGMIADATVFSFYPTKNITTGEGGMVVSNREELTKNVRLLSLHGMTSSGWKRFKGGSWKYDVVAPGYKCNISDINAALGVAQMKRFGEIQKRRENIALRYMKSLKDIEEYIELPYYPENCTHANHLFIIKINNERCPIDRDELIEKLESTGVGCGVHFIPVYHFSYFKKIFNCRPEDFPNCETAFNSVITLPLYPDLKNNEVDYVCETLRDLIT
jgi:perosamine synthetase